MRFLKALLLLVTCVPTSLLAEEIVGPGTRVEPLVRVAFTEGPVWHPSGNVYFSDIENNRIMRRDPRGAVHVYRTPSGRANGLVFDTQGRLVACEGSREGGNRRVTRTELDGSITVLTAAFEGKRYNSPNDIVCDKDGYLFFTDPRYGSRDDLEIFDENGKSIEGVYRIDPDGKVHRLLSHQIERPNGIAVSPDGRHLYVAVNSNDAEGRSRKLWRFDLNAKREPVADSQLLLFDWGKDRGPDGMAVDQRGRLYVTAGFNHPDPPMQLAEKYRAGVYIISPDDGALLATIPVPIDMITNCAFGGADGKTLFITAGHKLWSIPVSTPGFTAWPAR